jgi:hypothetical protein
MQDSLLYGNRVKAFYTVKKVANQKKLVIPKTILRQIYSKIAILQILHDCFTKLVVDIDTLTVHVSHILEQMHESAI